jgi:formate dehydrogenase maturation protein FdhE
MMGQRGAARELEPQESCITPQPVAVTPQEAISEHLSVHQCPYCLSKRTNMAICGWTHRIMQCDVCERQWLIDRKGDVVAFDNG